ncbi:MAG: hypothetical protein KIS66_16735 [Fimbriimonadaceae bacterium]|nr:hypothetical protein [Fimbriimonadaceae bacterium]
MSRVKFTLSLRPEAGAFILMIGVGRAVVGYVWRSAITKFWLAYDQVGGRYVKGHPTKWAARTALIESVKASIVALGKKIEEEVGS